MQEKGNKKEPQEVIEVCAGFEQDVLYDVDRKQNQQQKKSQKQFDETSLAGGVHVYAPLHDGEP